MSCQISPEQIDATIAFHGHSCPGLAIGIRAAELALRELENPKDTEIVAVVETDMCGVDALQFLLGTTMGKGNLIHRDHGKMAFSFFRRATGKGFRALLNPAARGGMDDEMAELMQANGIGTATEAQKNRMTELRAGLQQRFMTLPLEEMFCVTPVEQGAPRPPKILESLACAHCGEKTMESRTRRFAGQTLCIPCFQMVEQKI
ncbi:formylmethanofuran dehydrogenase subunit E [Desulfomicrobium norvegicum]|uniref:Formylmethanofuran dehydrogenase subunit E n=1 Tax=Desulfomicrobium norvegicum (strain DSM 1741 / NCIMB 8310) TaxID=52561 RepID=A0A8G2F6P0_DESNO|nr:FmdE family protein [Desulfomicrobium norvegicum]SFL30018.1 formylmethanofuran dehydrogenase subunit E [Desulfomicrobium norvegicum]